MFGVGKPRCSAACYNESRPIVQKQRDGTKRKTAGDEGGRGDQAKRITCNRRKQAKGDCIIIQYANGYGEKGRA